MEVSLALVVTVTDTRVVALVTVISMILLRLHNLHLFEVPLLANLSTCVRRWYAGKLIINRASLRLLLREQLNTGWRESSCLVVITPLYMIRTLIITFSAFLTA